ncbi:MAG: nitroreductase family protein [Clostridia bacterium]|nr:nitroreductase family protein [Clostridia bacterium]
MTYFSQLALSRRSIRKYADTEISLEEIEEFIRIATSAPSGCNSQCWRFVAITDKNVMDAISKAVISKMDQIINSGTDEISSQYLDSKRKMLTFFSKAPVVIAVFMTKMEFLDTVMIKALKDKGYDDEGIMKFFAYPDLLSIGAAVQNLLLAVHEKGYGACWMNDPAIAGDEIRKILGVTPDSKFISLIPIGVPAYSPREKKMKDLCEIYTIK